MTHRRRCLTGEESNPGKWRVALAALVASPICTAAMPGAAGVATFTISPCVVGTGTGASCTEAALNACLPGGGSFDGTVTFNCGGAAMIAVTSTKTISAGTTIDGGGLVTISGGKAVRVFSVSTGVNFTVQNLTIANGKFNAGAGGSAIFNNAGTVTVTNSTISGNTTSMEDGGALYNFGGTVTVTNSTFSGNSAVHGGGISDGSGKLTVVTNSTFSGNSAPDGGGIFNHSGTATVTNTIVADSTSGGNCASDGGAVTDGGHNIDDGTTCGFTGTGCTDTTRTSFCNTDPVLDPSGLQNNGGPTQTIALLAGSPAIDAGDEAACAAPPVNNLDQRGYVRPGDGATSCSIGAYEYKSPGPPPSCEGDCNSDRHVTVDEILTMVNIALGNVQVCACEAGDANPDGQITIDEILRAVNNALNGCSVPTATGTWDCISSTPGTTVIMTLVQSDSNITGSEVTSDGYTFTITGSISGLSLAVTEVPSNGGGSGWTSIGTMSADGNSMTSSWSTSDGKDSGTASCVKRQ